MKKSRKHRIRSSTKLLYGINRNKATGPDEIIWQDSKEKKEPLSRHCYSAFEN